MSLEALESFDVTAFKVTPDRRCNKLQLSRIIRIRIMVLSLIRCRCCSHSLSSLSQFYLFSFSSFSPVPPSRPFFLIHTFLAGLTCDAEIVSLIKLSVVPLWFTLSQGETTQNLLYYASALSIHLDCRSSNYLAF